MSSLVKVLETKVGKKIAENADKVLAGVLEERQAEQRRSRNPVPGTTNVH